MNTVYITLSTGFFILINIILFLLSLLDDISIVVIFIGLITSFSFPLLVYQKLPINKYSSFGELIGFTFTNAFGSFVVVIILSLFGDLISQAVKTHVKTNEIQIEQMESGRKTLDQIKGGFADEMLPDNGQIDKAKETNKALLKGGKNFKDATTEPSQLSRINWALISSFGPSLLALLFTLLLACSLKLLEKRHKK
tara:strand:+ start:8917 stop:9504 length:588 start_codon:yes stop_codon:yes gene_type:complete